MRKIAQNNSKSNPSHIISLHTYLPVAASTWGRPLAIDRVRRAIPRLRSRPTPPQQPSTRCSRRSRWYRIPEWPWVTRGLLFHRWDRASFPRWEPGMRPSLPSGAFGRLNGERGVPPVAGLAWRGRPLVGGTFETQHLWDTMGSLPKRTWLLRGLRCWKPCQYSSISKSRSSTGDTLGLFFWDSCC